MTERMPVVFVSHGAPDALLKSPDTVTCWREIGQRVFEPSAILVISAHWESGIATASMANAPETIYDFSGFSPSLYRMKYPVPGAPALARRVLALLAAKGLKAEPHPVRGLDHGAWVPLSVMFPNSDIPVTQLSLVRDGSSLTHFEIGQALAPLRDEGVLILTSGAITHNFSWLNWRADENSPPFPKARAFADWVAEKVAAHDTQALLAYRAAPFGLESHPTEEHFMPLMVALGAAMGDMPSRYRPNFAYAGLSMDAYVWSDSKNATL